VNTPALSESWGKGLLRQALVALLFFGLSYLTLSFAGEIERHVSPVWPAAGLAMAAVFFFGPKILLGIFIGAMASNAMTTWQEFPDMALWRIALSSGGIAMGAALEAMVAARFLQSRAGGRNFCLSAGHASAFVLVVALLPAAISALIGPSFLTLCGVFPTDRWLLVVLTWFVGDATGILVMGAALIFPWRSIDPVSLRGRWPEALMLLLTLLLLIGNITGIYEKSAIKEWPREYMILPVILWAIFRFNHLGTLATLVILTVCGVVGSSLGHEVFPSTKPGYGLFFLQMFLLILSAVAWAVCGRVNELQILTGRLEDLVASGIVTQRETLRRREEKLAVLAHDLQVPLIGIRNLIELLLDPRRSSHDPEKSRHLLTEIGKASEQARHLAERLLEEQEIDTLHPQQEELDWVELVRGVARRASLLDASRELRFVTLTDSPRIIGTVDRVVLMQVLENLCHNAAKVSPRGGTVSLHLREEGDAVVITLADQGPGFRREEIPMLFTNFGFRERLRKQRGSSGLGLFIVGKAVRELGGTIACTSAENEGAIFVIRLPRRAI
jgi:signal transduction histidine kinase